MTHVAAARGARFTWSVAAAALLASLGLLLWTSQSEVSTIAYWTVSSIAITVALAVLVTAEQAWDQMVTSARAAGVIAR